MGLSNAPGSQVEGINTQGIEVNKDHIGINIDWVDPQTNQFFDPTTYSVSITQNGSPYSETNLRVMTPLARLDDTVGVWGYEFLIKDMGVGTYVFTFTGEASGIDPVSHVLTFKAAEIPVEQYFVGALRAKLGDKRASRYLIDDNTRYRWTNGEIYSCLDNARLSIGQEPPAPMIMTWEQAYAEAHNQMLLGGFICALEARGVFENFNKFNYNDELSLNVDRSNFFQNAQSLRASWLLSIQRWKRDYMFHSVRGIGMASGRFPLYYSRVLSLMPHMQNVFYG